MMRRIGLDCWDECAGQALRGAARVVDAELLNVAGMAGSGRAIFFMACAKS